MFRAIYAMMLLFLGTTARAECADYRLVIENHRFSPAEISVPAGTKVRLIIENRDATPEEFESYELNREKIVPGYSSITVFIGPLKPGRYSFFGEFHKQLAQGVVVVSENTRC